VSAALLLGPCALLGLSATAWAAGRELAGRWLALGGAAMAGLVAVAGPAGVLEAPALLLGASAGLDPAGRAALVVAGAVALAGARWRPPGRRPGDAEGDLASAGWLALLAAGLAATAVAFDVATLSVGYTAVLLAAAVLLLLRPGGAAEAGRGRAAAFLLVAVPGEVLLVDALAELGHAARDTRLPALAAAAAAHLGHGEEALLVGAFGLPLCALGLKAPAAVSGALAAQAAVGLARLLPAAAGPAEVATVAALVGALGLVAAQVARRLAPALPRAPLSASAGHHGAGHAAHHGAHGDGHAAAPALAPWPAPGRAEGWLRAAGASGALLLTLLLLLAFLVARESSP